MESPMKMTKPTLNSRKWGKIKKRSVIVNGKKTSVSLEDDFWLAFDIIARATDTSKWTILAALSKQHANLSSGVRVAVLSYYVERAKMLESIAQPIPSRSDESATSDRGP
jgi:predicted DNA-binding ribbon-helix-helix protein